MEQVRLSNDLIRVAVLTLQILLFMAQGAALPQPPLGQSCFPHCRVSKLSVINHSDTFSTKDGPNYHISKTFIEEFL